MLETMIYASSDIILLIGAIFMFLFHFFKKENPRTYFLVAKFSLLSALCLSLIFYNKIFAVEYLTENSYTTMVKVLVYLFSIVWYYVSFKWFAGKNLSGYMYCAIGLLLTETLCVLISSVNLISLFLAVFIFSLMENILMKNHLRQEGDNLKDKYFGCFSSFLILFGGMYIYKISGSFSYGVIYEYLSNNKVDMYFCLACALVIAPLFYMLGAFPLSFSRLDTQEKTILPISGYMAIIPPIAVFSAIFVIFHQMLFPIYELFRPALITLAVLSLFYGAFGAKKEHNLRLIFAYSSIYHFGVVVLIMSYMDAYAILSAYVYLIIYIMALFGIYTAMYAFKSRGEYMTDIKEIAGVYQPLPYIASSVMILTLSMLGTPPLLGFLGRFYITNQLFMAKEYILVLLVLLPLGILVSAYLKIIKSMYFEPRTKNFDRVDKGIYITLFINIMSVMITLFNNYEVVKIARDIIYKLF